MAYVLALFIYKPINSKKGEKKMADKNKAIECLEKIKKNIDFCRMNGCEDKLYNTSYKAACTKVKEVCITEIRIWGKDEICSDAKISSKLYIKLNTMADKIIYESQEIKDVIDEGNVAGLNAALLSCKRKWYDYYVIESQKAYKTSKSHATELKIAQ